MRQHLTRTKLAMRYVLFTLMLGNVICALKSAPTIPFMIWPLGKIDVAQSIRTAAPDLNHLTFHAFYASPTSLYFLISNGPTTDNSQLVKTSLTGVLSWSLPLGPNPVINLSVLDSGGVRVFSLPSQGPAVEEDISAAGKVLRSWHEPLFSGATSTVGDHALLAAHGKVADARSGQFSGQFTTYVDVLGQYITASLDAQHIARINIHTAGIEILDLSDGTSKIAELSSTALETARNVYAATPDNGVVVLSAARDSQGRLYLLTSGFNINTGPTIVVVNSSGQVTSELECFLSRGAGGQIAAPMGIAVTQHTLLILTEAGNLFSFDLNTPGVHQ